MSVTLFPETVHVEPVFDVNVTGNPEDAVPETVIGVALKGKLLIAPKVMV